MNNPFLDNFKHFMGNQNLGSFTSDMMNKNSETYSAVMQVMAKNTQNLMRKNAEIWQESTGHVFDIFKAGTAPDQVAHKAQETMRHGLENAIASTKTFIESCTKANVEALELFSKRTADNMESCMAQASTVARDATAFAGAATGSADKKK